MIIILIKLKISISILNMTSCVLFSEFEIVMISFSKNLNENSESLINAPHDTKYNVRIS